MAAGTSDAAQPRGPAAQAPRPATPGDDVRGEAARFRARLAGARERVGALAPAGAADDVARGDAAPDLGAPRGVGAPQSGVSPRVGVSRIDEDDDDNADLRALLAPAATRIAHLVELAGALADGTLTDAAAAEAARAVANTQPSRRTR